MIIFDCEAFFFNSYLKNNLFTSFLHVTSTVDNYHASQPNCSNHQPRAKEDERVKNINVTLADASSKLPVVETITGDNYSQDELSQDSEDWDSELEGNPAPSFSIRTGFSSGDEQDEFYGLKLPMDSIIMVDSLEILKTMMTTLFKVYIPIQFLKTIA